MFTNIAYEAFYSYIGLELHSKSIEIISSEKVLWGVLTIVFGATLLFMLWHFASGYMPSALVKKHAVPISAFIKLIACLFIGVSLLQIGSTASIKNYSRGSWHSNSYVQTKKPDVQENYRVSFIFDLLSRTADEISRYFVSLIDRMFEYTNPETTAPNYFYKAIMYAGSDTIEDPALREKIRYYTDECFTYVLPVIAAEHGNGNVDGFFRPFPAVDNALKKIKLKDGDPNSPDCLNVKDDVLANLQSYAISKTSPFDAGYFGPRSPLISPQVHANQFASQALVNYFWDSKENWLGMQNGTQLDGLAGKSFQLWNRVWSWDGILSLTGNHDLQGASEHAKRSLEFNEMLQRAPHLAGMTKMILIAIFPWLVFLLAAGRWKALVSWFAIYASVALWAPVWTLFYHIISGVAISSDVMSRFGELSDGISMYASELITSRLYRMYSLYTWIQIAVGPLPTAILAARLMPWMLSKEEQTPELVSATASVATSVVPGGSVVNKLK